MSNTKSLIVQQKVMSNKKEISTFDRFDMVMTKGKKEECEICGKKFSVFLREHTCKRCFRAVCDNCKSIQHIIYQQNFTRKEHGLCKACNVETEFIKNYVSKYKLEFGVDSEVGQKWLKRLKTEDSSKKQQIKKQVVFTEQMFQQLWNSYNFSFREFIGILTFQRKKEDVYKLVYRVIKEVGQRVEIRIQYVTYLVMFLLCHCSAQTSVKILVELQFSLKQNPPNKENVVNYLKILGCDIQQIKKLDEFIDYKFKKFVQMFGINVFTTYTSLYAFEQLIARRKIQQIEKYFASTVYQHKSFILGNLKNKNQIQYYILKNLSLSAIEKSFATISTEDKKKNGTSIRSNSNLEVIKAKSEIIINQTDEQSPNKKRSTSIVMVEEQKNLQFEVALQKLKQSEEDKNKLVQQNLKFKKKVNMYEDSDKLIEEKDKKIKDLQEKIQKLNEEIKKLRQINNRSSVMIQQPHEDHQSNIQLQVLKLEIKEMQAKLKRMQIQNLSKQKQKQRLEQQIRKMKDDESKKSTDLKNHQNQIQLLKMKIQNFEISNQVNPLLNDQIQELKKENISLSTLLKEKNSKIDNLMRQIKLLDYQLQKQNTQPRQNGSRPESSQIQALKLQIQKLKAQNSMLLNKLQTLSLNIVQQQQKQLEDNRSEFNDYQMEKKKQQCVIF